MFAAVTNALAELFLPPLRRVLVKSVALALVLILIFGIGLQHVLGAMAERGADWAEQTVGYASHSAWSALAFILSILGGLGVITGAVFLMPAVTAFVGSFFVDEVADAIERRDYPRDPPGKALPLPVALGEGVKFALLTIVVYLCALPFVLFAGAGLIIMLVANAYLLGREYFELAAMRFHTPHEAKRIRKRNAVAVFVAGLAIAVFVSVPVLNLATPIFAMTLMVHIHKRLAPLAMGKSQ
jgi:CysZ protein